MNAFLRHLHRLTALLAAFWEQRRQARHIRRQHAVRWPRYTLMVEALEERTSCRCRHRRSCPFTTRVRRRS